MLVSCGTGSLSFYVAPPTASVSAVKAVTPPEVPLEVVGYLPDYKIDAVEPEQIRQLTDVVYFALSTHRNGTVNTDSLTPSRAAFLHQVQQEYGTRVLVGIAEHSSRGHLQRVVRSKALRAVFVRSLVDLLTAQGYDGADLDWEYPLEVDQAGYAALLLQIHEAFAPQGWRLTVAVSPSRPLTQAAYDAVDQVHGMLYDDWGRHATLANAETHITAMLAQGVDPAKLLLGVPFYGRGYTKSGPSWSAAVSYKTLQERYQPAPNQDTASGYYFNGVDTVRQKVAYARATHLAGIMVWEIGQDTTDDSSLLTAITDASKSAPRLN